MISCPKNSVYGKFAANALCAWFCLALMSGCADHQPAPVVEHSRAPVKPQSMSDTNHEVRRGDTLYAIAFSYGLDPQTLAEWNGISSPYVIYPGQTLRLTATPVTRQGQGSDGVQISTIKTPGQATTRTHTQAEPEVSSGQSSQTPVKSTPPTSDARKEEAPAPVIPAASPATDPTNWKWPTNGRVLRGYVAGDPARNGLDISGKEGQAIIASAGGQVVYSGNGLIGYGELIIIKHSEKMLSAYAHNKVRLVKEGDQVSQGQKIAEMGRNTGDEQLLHFEIRSRGKPVNPLNYLPSK